MAGAHVVAYPQPPAVPYDPFGFGHTSAPERWDRLPPSWDLAARATVTTGPDGTADVTGLDAGFWSVATSAPGRVRRVAHATAAPGCASAEVELTAEPGHAFEGRVTSPGGRALAGCIVLATYPGIAHQGRTWATGADFSLTRTDAAGRFRFDALPAAEVSFRVAPPGTWCSRVWRVRVPGIASLEFQPDASGPVTGTLTWTPGGSPVAHARLFFEFSGSHPARGAARVVTGADGRFETGLLAGHTVTSVDAEAADGSVRAGTVSVAGFPRRIDGDAPVRMDLLVTRRAEPPQPRGGRVTGRVLDDVGRPVARAEVRGPADARTVTGADGRFVLGSLGTRVECNVAAVSPDGSLEGESARIRAGGGFDVDGVEFKLMPRWVGPDDGLLAIEGMVRVPGDDRPPASGHVECSGTWTPLDGSGGFRIEMRRRGAGIRLPIVVVVPGHGERVRDLEGPWDDPLVRVGTIVVPRSARIRGRVADSHGPLAGAEVCLMTPVTSIGSGRPKPTLAAVTGADGTFELTAVPHGTHDLRISCAGHVDSEPVVIVDVTRPDGVEVRPHITPGVPDAESDVSVVPHAAGAPEIRVVLAREALLAGRVVRRDGRPVSRAMVRATRAANPRDGRPGSHVRGRTDDDGRFSVRVREGESYLLEVRPAGADVPDAGVPEFAVRRAGPFPAGDTAVAVDVFDCADIAGRVLRADGTPVLRANVSCVATGPDAASRSAPAPTRSGTDGGFAFRAVAAGEYDVTVVAGQDAPIVVRGVSAGRNDIEVRLPAPSDR